MDKLDCKSFIDVQSTLKDESTDDEEVDDNVLSNKLCGRTNGRRNTTEKLISERGEDEDDVEDVDDDNSDYTPEVCTSDEPKDNEITKNPRQ